MAERRGIKIGRIYDVPSKADGQRVLVDRVWPRGVSREKAALHEWCKAVAPSSDLRKWYGHDPERFEEFSRRYLAELDGGEPAASLVHLRELADRGTLTLLTATKAIDISQAAVLAGLLGQRG